MTWIVNEAVDREMYKLSRLICDGETGEAAERHRQICWEHRGAPRPKPPKNDEKNRQKAATQARTEQFAELRRGYLRVIIDSGIEMIMPSLVAELTGCTQKIAAHRMRAWADTGEMEFIGYSAEYRKQAIYRLTDRAYTEAGYEEAHQR